MIPVAALPSDALGTIRLIRAGGPFPEQRDGSEFANEGGLLPVHEAGYYREYWVRVVDAPGVDVIIAGGRGEMYWSTDGARSFLRVVP